MNTSEEKYRDIFRNQLDDQSPEEFHEELWLEALAKLEAVDNEKPIAAPLPSNDGAQRSWGRWGLLLFLFTTVASLGYLFWPENIPATTSQTAQVRSGEHNESTPGTMNATTTAQANSQNQYTNTASEMPAIAANANNNLANGASNPNTKTTTNSTTSSDNPSTLPGNNNEPQLAASLLGTKASTGRAKRQPNLSSTAPKASKVASGKAATATPQPSSSKLINKGSNASGAKNSVSTSRNDASNPNTSGLTQTINNDANGNNSIPNTSSDNNDQNNATPIAKEDTENTKGEFAYLGSLKSVWEDIAFANTQIDSRAFGPGPPPPPPPPPSKDIAERIKGWEFGLLLGSGAEFGNTLYTNGWAAASVRYNFSGRFGLQVAPGGIYHAGSQGITRTSRVEVYSFDSTATSSSYRPTNAILLELPILFHYRPHNKHGFYLGGGASYILNSLSEINASQTDGSIRQNTAWGYNLEQGKIGAFGRVGYEWRFSKRLHLNLSGQREFSLQSVAPWSIRLGFQWKI